MPTINFAAIEKKNETNLKKLENGGRLPVLYTMAAGKAVILIGAGHDPGTQQLVEESKHDSGIVEIKKGGAFGAGALKVTGVRSNRSQFETAIAKFSKKKVIFS